jgi:3-methyladenine DNA glycosylase Tag
VRPGVDGDVAGAWSSSDAFDQQLLDALERETRLAGLSWSIVPEAAL